VTPSVVRRIANVPASEPDRMTDDGRSMNDWYRQLGVSHRRRDEAAGDESRALQERDRERETAMRRRWAGIVAAMRALAGCYNEGAGLDMLTVVDDAGGESRDLIVTTVARGGQTLTMTLIGAELCVRPSPGTAGSPDDGRRWITFEASDEATAAHALQPWLAQL